MTDFVVLDSSHLGVDRIATSPTVFALYENLFAFAEKAAGSPVLANSYVVEAMLSSNIVSQSKLRTTTGDVAVASDSAANLALPGGTYGFYPQVWQDAAGGSGIDEAKIWGGSAIPGTTPVTYMYIDAAGIANFARGRQRYVQASPPYDLGDGDVPLFVFAMLDRSGKVLAMYSAEDPPWANNGPTLIRPEGVNAQGKLVRRVRPRANLSALRDPAKRQAELARVESTQAHFEEVTQELKQRDMSIIPHPFMANDLSNKVIVMLDPMSDILHTLRDEQIYGDGSTQLVTDGHIMIGNSPLNRSAPPGVMAAPVRWK